MKELTQKEIDEKLKKEQEEEKAKILENMEALRYNRATRRKMMKAIHHNVFTKKYKNMKTKENAWRNLYKEEDYILIKRTQKKLMNPNYKMPALEQKNIKNTLFKPQKIG